jgi:hypothetical protein
MKVNLLPRSSDWIINLIPETEEDEKELWVFARSTQRAVYVFEPAIFKYKQPDVDFVVKPITRGG